MKQNGLTPAGKDRRLIPPTPLSWRQCIRGTCPSAQGIHASGSIIECHDGFFIAYRLLSRSKGVELIDGNVVEWSFVYTHADRGGRGEVEIRLKRRWENR
ncbi:hypothetical protein CEXT_311401 [Caerostris extrusa]|uniref:Uncharacterized protein n=1 Tax=Caerostris extrusa TaxID=172846 RepID=A0AAV4N1S2_CAEEX|nr:hypothetical protein CEXT_311401 [Caerostris extrusa]